MDMEASVRLLRWKSRDARRFSHCWYGASECWTSIALCWDPSGTRFGALGLNSTSSRIGVLLMLDECGGSRSVIMKRWDSKERVQGNIICSYSKNLFPRWKIVWLFFQEAANIDMGVHSQRRIILSKQPVCCLAIKNTSLLSFNPIFRSWKRNVRHDQGLYRPQCKTQSPRNQNLFNYSFENKGSSIDIKLILTQKSP